MAESAVRKERVFLPRKTIGKLKNLSGNRGTEQGEAPKGGAGPGSQGAGRKREGSIQTGEDGGIEIS